MDRGWVCLSQPIYEGMPAARTHGEVSIRVQHLPLGPPDAAARITHLSMATHVGTHVDAAVHFIPGGRSIDEYPQEAFTGPGTVLDVRREGVVTLGREELDVVGRDVRAGDIVLLHFGYGERFGDPGYYDHPYLSPDTADWFVERGVRMVGVDTVTPDMPGAHRPPDYDFPVHMALLSRDILIMENLGPALSGLAGRRLEVLAVPLPIRGADGSPVMAMAREVDA
jgi:kynurenine formamidase